MVCLPTQLANDLERLSADSHGRLPDRVAQSAAEIEELISKAIDLYGRLNRRHERWAEPIRQGKQPFDLQEGKLWQITFQAWCDDARQIILQANALEGSGQLLEQLDDLRSRLMHCDYDGIDIEQLIANAAHHGQGRGTPASEIKDELQRRLRANGQG
jgi:hypothetical protein